jgi:hypothetical protein
MLAFFCFRVAKERRGQQPFQEKSRKALAEMGEIARTMPESTLRLAAGMSF